MKKIDQITDDPKRYIQNLIANFKIPGRDALMECLLTLPGTQVPNWDSAVILSTGQSKNFYTDIFQFWVRAFFCFVEDTQDGSLFRDMIPFIVCRKISTKEFKQNYLSLLKQRIQDEAFLERQKYPKTYIELEKRSFSDTYAVINHSNFKSSVASSEGEFATFFVTTQPNKRIRIIK
jgi:hypothetical protein